MFVGMSVCMHNFRTALTTDVFLPGQSFCLPLGLSLLSYVTPIPETSVYTPYIPFYISLFNKRV